MAKRNYLVDGVSGAGKSSVYEELIRRGYKAVTTDRAWKRTVHPDTGRGEPAHSIWHEQKALSELESPVPDVLFVCGSSSNRQRFLPYFTRIFNLRIDDDTMRRRLRERTNNDYGKQPDELELMLALNRSEEKVAGAIDVDATRSLRAVVDDVLRLADCSEVNSEAPATPWSKGASEIGASFVISEGALPNLQAAADRKNIVSERADAFWDVLSRETMTCIEFAWSGAVVATLLIYLEQQGMDLLHSGHDQMASALAQARDRTVAIFTPDHRERYLARLDPAEFDGDVLRRYYEAVNKATAVDVGYAMLDAIAFVRDTLAALERGTVAVFISEYPRRPRRAMERATPDR